VYLDDLAEPHDGQADLGELASWCPTPRTSGLRRRLGRQRSALSTSPGRRCLASLPTRRRAGPGGDQNNKANVGPPLSIYLSTVFGD
jgi:DNA-binding IclR family transcriptional regulator